MKNELKEQWQIFCLFVVVVAALVVAVVAVAAKSKLPIPFSLCFSFQHPLEVAIPQNESPLLCTADIRKRFLQLG